MKARRAEHPGITFRSKLEAQWSAIFDEMGWTWEYEPVRFDLPSGIYIPDFKIRPRAGDPFWVEIKGPWPNAREFEVATEVNIYAQTPLIILTGDVPRQINGGTAWWFDPATDRWSMLRSEEGLIRVLWPDAADRPERLAGWGDVLENGRRAEIIT